MIWGLLALLTMLLGALVWVLNLGRRLSGVQKELDRIKDAKAQSDRINKAKENVAEELLQSEKEKQKIKSSNDLNSLMRLYEKIIPTRSN